MGDQITNNLINDGDTFVLVLEMEDSSLRLTVGECWRQWRLIVSYKKVHGDLQGNVQPVNKADASSPLQQGPRRKVCYT